MLLQAKDAHSRLLLPKKNPVIMPSQHVQQTPSSSAASSNGERTLVNRDQGNDRVGASSSYIGTRRRHHYRKTQQCLPRETRKTVRSARARKAL